MRIRKRRAQEVDPPTIQPSSSSAAALQRKDRIDRLEIGSERFELVTRSGGEAAALSLVLLAAEGVPHIAQECEARKNYFRADSGVRSKYRSHSVDSLSNKEKLDRSSNAKDPIIRRSHQNWHYWRDAASGQFASEKGRTTQHVSSRMHETGSYTTSSSEGNLPPEKIEEDKEISTRTDSDVEEGFNHPCDQREGSLTHSLCCIFSELPGSVGLSAREALSKIQEKGLPGLIEGDGVPSVQVAKIMRSNPCFVPVRGGKYLFARSPESLDFERNEPAPDSSSKEEIQKTRGVRQHAETGHGRVSSSSKDGEKEVTGISEPSSQGDNVGTRCTRVDGRSWQCRRTSMPGFSLCEHHHLQLSSQSRRQRNFQRAFNQSSRKRLRKGEKKGDAKGSGEAQEGNRTSNANPNADSGRRKVVKARSLEAIVRGTVDVGSVNSSPSIS